MNHCSRIFRTLLGTSCVMSNYGVIYKHMGKRITKDTIITHDVDGRELSPSQSAVLTEMAQNLRKASEQI